MAVRNALESFPVCTFFCGTVRAIEQISKGARISNGHNSYTISSVSDKGLEHLPVGKRRLVVICSGKIVAVYIRPRIQLIRRLESESELGEAVLLSYRPIYPEGFAKLEKK